MSHLAEMVIAVVCAVIASSGFWAFLQARLNRKSNATKLLLGLAHDRICFLGLEYLKRDPPYITHDEYENLHDYLYVPYEKEGGNGSAKKIMEAVNSVPLRKE